MNSKNGTLYIVATPIGNLGDFSDRAREILDQVSLILAEDTRHCAKLLSHFGISTKTRSLHEHNEEKQVDWVLNQIRKGNDMALVSDAGTPLISDPGFSLVRNARAAGISVSPIPGPSAVVAALSVAGLPVDRFCFEGFLPGKGPQRRNILTELARETRTLVFYESSHRVQAALDDMVKCLGQNRQGVIGREITKKFETFYSGSLESLCEEIRSSHMNQKGEFVIVVAGAVESAGDEAGARELLKLLLDQVPLKKASEIVSMTFGLNRNRVYQIALEMKEGR